MEISLAEEFFSARRTGALTSIIGKTTKHSLWFGGTKVAGGFEQPRAGDTTLCLRRITTPILTSSIRLSTTRSRLEGSRSLAII